MKRTTLKKAKLNTEMTSMFSTEQMPRHFSGVYSNHKLNTNNNATLLRKELLQDIRLQQSLYQQAPKG